MSIVSTTTIDVITRGLIKYRLITHAAANAIGSELIRLNHLAESGLADHPDDERNTVAAFYPYTRRPFERKVKRVALDGAILAWQENTIGLNGIENMPVTALVQRLYEKNLDRIRNQDWDFESAPADIEDTDEARTAIMIRSREERQEENRLRLAERMAAAQAARAANPESSNDEDMDDEDEWDDEATDVGYEADDDTDDES
jgi:hypothetical protein